MYPTGSIVVGGGRRHELIELEDFPDQVGGEGGVIFRGFV